jgi:DNA-binding transcriptional MerR regulator
MDTYSVKQAADATGISKPALRVYTRRYTRWLSSEATPSKGEARTFTPDDLRLLKFVFDATTAGATHAQVVTRLEAGELAAYPWQPETSPPESEDTAVMAPDQVRLIQAMLEHYQQREDAARARESALAERIEELQLQLGEAKGRLAEVRAARYRAPRWLRSLFGGRGE